MFGDPVVNNKNWKISPFSQVGKFYSGGTPSKSRVEYWKGNFPWVSPKDMKSTYIKDSQDHISEAVFSETSLKRIRPFNLLIVVRGMILAHSFPTAVNLVEIAINQDMKAIEPSEKLNVFYLLMCINALKRKILSQISSASHGTKKFDSSLMNNLKIPVPPLKLQINFAKIAVKTEAVKAQYQESLKHLEDLYSSLSQLSFKGYLFVGFQPSTASKDNANELEQMYFLKRKVLATYIINQSLNDPQFGDVKFEKLLHLSEYFVIKRNLNQNYLQKAAGPYDNAFTIPFFKQIESSKWFTRTKKGAQYVFKPGSKHNSSINTYGYFSDDELKGVDRLIAYFKKYAYEQPEIISTLYAVWNNRMIRQQSITDELLKEDFLKWDAQKIKYKDRLDAALNWMRKEGLVPDAWGKLIEKPKAKKLKRNGQITRGKRG